MKFRRKASRARVDDRRGRRRRGRRRRAGGDAGRAGPFDVDELPERRRRAGRPRLAADRAAEGDRELRLQVDEATGEVQSVMLAGADGALELRAFAAPRNGDLWSEVRPQIAADMAAARRHRHRARGPLRHRAGLPDDRCSRGDGTTAHPAVADHRHQRPALAAARHAARPPGRRARRRGRLGGRAHAGSPSAAATHAMPVGDPLPVVAARRTPDASTEPDRERLGPAMPPRRAGCAAASAAGPTAPTSTRATCARRTPSPGVATIADAPDRERVRLRGTLRTVTLRPRGGVPALEAELFDGSGVITRGLAGPAPDRRHRARAGRSRSRAGSAPTTAYRIMYNPRYELRAVSEPRPRADAGTEHEHRAPTPSTRSRPSSARQLAKALGGRRGMVEAAVPTLLFTVTVADHHATCSSR